MYTMGRLFSLPAIRLRHGYVRRNYHAYAFGDGFLGTLGHASTPQPYVPVPTLVDALASYSLISADCGWGHTVYLTNDGTVILLGRPTDFKNTLRHIHMRGTIPAFQRALTMFGTKVFKDDFVPQFYSFARPNDDDHHHHNDADGKESNDSTITKLSSTVVRNFMKAISSPTQSVLGPSSTSSPFTSDSSSSSSSSSSTSSPPLPTSITPVQVVCGKGALTGVLTQEGNVFMLGANSFGQCGNEKVSEIESDFVMVQGIESNERIINLSLGLEHGAAVSNYGTVYTWGRGDRGQCGHGDNAHYKQAVRLAGPDHAWLFTKTDTDHDLDHKFITVSCGHAITTAINAKGELWIWGKMASTVPKKSIGDGEIMQDQLVPRRITFPDETEKNEKNGKGTTTKTVSFRSILEERNIVKLMETNDKVSPANTLLIRADTLVKGVYVPNPHEEQQNNTAMGNRRVVAVTHGQAHTSILCDDGSIWMIGLRGRGVLYDDSDTKSVPLPLGGTDEPENVGGPTLVIPSTVADSKNENHSAAVASGSSSLSTDTKNGVPIPEVRIEVEPFRITNLGPLYGKTITKLRSSLHHSFAVTDQGEVYRWGWKGIVRPVTYFETVVKDSTENIPVTNKDVSSSTIKDANEREESVRDKNVSKKNLRPQEIAFGYAHTIVLA